MAQPNIPPRAKLFIGVIYAQEEPLRKAEIILIKKFGEIDFQTKPIPFVHTDYYKDMGTGLSKMFYSFKKLIRREDIVKLKLFTNKLESKFAEKEKRVLNIDPGYLTLSNVFLASCKEYFHRAYLGKGVYLENEFRYVARNFEPWDWTYPDYRKHEYLHFFYEIRKIYHKQLKD